MDRKKEWIWEMQGELTVADAASSRYRGMILRVSERTDAPVSEQSERSVIAKMGGTADQMFVPGI